MVPVFKNVRERSTAKNDDPVSLFSLVRKVFEKLVHNSIVDQLQKWIFFLNSCMVLDISHQFQIFLQLYLAELVELLTGLKL